MKDFFGKEIKVGDIVELRADGADEGSRFEKGVVKYGSGGTLLLWRTRVNESRYGTITREYYYTPLDTLNMSNDIVKV